MDDGTTETPVVIHSVSEPKSVPRDTLLFLRYNNKYTLVWSRSVERYGKDYPYWWHSADEFLNIRVSIDIPYEEQRIMNDFIRDYFGEDRWTMALLRCL